MENRTLRILEAIVDEYIRTGEAVGSKLIAEKLDNAHRLLYTSQCGERSDLFQAVTVEMQVVAV